MPKTHKFEEATFKDDNGIIIEESISLNRLIELKEKDSISFDKEYKGHLYCPDCHTVQLSLVEKKFLRSYPDRSHDLSCHYYSESVSSVPIETSELPEDTPKNRKHICHDLQALIDKLLMENLQNDHSGSTKKRDNQNSNTSVTKQVTKRKKSTLKYPERKLSSPITENDLGQFKLFYGNVDVKFDTRKNKKEGTTFYSMSVFLQGTSKVMFSIGIDFDAFPDINQKAHYAFVPDNGQRYSVLVAVATILKKNGTYINGSIHYRPYCLNIIKQQIC